MASAGQRRFQFSVGSLLAVTGALAFLLVPVAWVARERQQMLRARDQMLQAREVALHSVVLATERNAKLRAEIELHQPSSPPTVERASGPGLITPDLNPNQTVDSGTELVERLRLENADLRKEVAMLRREVERLKSNCQR
jgi:uncharacterized small protein (DUF1192 family)